MKDLSEASTSLSPTKQGGSRGESTKLLNDDEATLGADVGKANKATSDKLPHQPIGKNTGQAKMVTRLLDLFSLEKIVDLKLARFFDQLNGFYPENLHALILKKIERPLIGQVLKRVGGNQVQAAQILGINRNTLRKKMKLYDL